MRRIDRFCYVFQKEDSHEGTPNRYFEAQAGSRPGEYQGRGLGPRRARPGPADGFGRSFTGVDRRVSAVQAAARWKVPECQSADCGTSTT